VKVWIITNLSHFITSGPDFDFLELCLSVPRLRYWCLIHVQVRLLAGFSKVQVRLLAGFSKVQVRLLAGFIKV
jgi:hypothetical protein